MGGRFQETYFPPELPEHVVVCPTMDRWGSVDSPGNLPRHVGSVQDLISRDRLSDSTIALVADASPRVDVDTRVALLNGALREVSRPSRILMMLPEQQRSVVNAVVEQTGIRRQLVEAVLSDTGYSGQRAKIDVPVSAVALGGSRHGVVTFDDDTLLPKRYPMVCSDRLPQGFSDVVNSQVLLLDGMESEDLFRWRDNSLRPFFAHLGKTAGGVRRDGHSELRVAEWMKDTMNQQIGAVSLGKPAQFVVSHGEGMVLPDDSIVIAVTDTKTGVPDFRTVSVAELYLRSGLPDREVPARSFLSGPQELYGFQKTPTNVDSANFSRLVDGDTALLLWWFVSNAGISQRNPLKTVDGQYRSDNELLPRLLEILSRDMGRKYVYLAGLESQVQHERARACHRPHIIEQSTASLVGNIAAVEALNRLSVRNGSLSLEAVSENYEVPVESARRVYDQLWELASICEAQINQLKAGINHAEKISEYERLFSLLRSKLGGFDFDTFRKHMSVEIRDQLKFYGEVLEAYPKIVREVRELIQGNMYPVVEYVHERRSVSRVPAGRSAVVVSA